MVHPEWLPVESVEELSTVIRKESVLFDPDASFISLATRAAALKGGLTNRLYCIDTPRGIWVVRVSGENYEVHNIDRMKEFICIRAACSIGITPDALFVAPEFLTISRFVVDGHTWNNDTVQKHIPECAAVIKKLHTIPLSSYSDHVFDVFGVCRQYITTASESGAPLPADLPEVMFIADRIEAAVARSTRASYPTVACHNDLLAANWIFGTIDHVTQLWLIDFDYAAAGDLFFDLANFSGNCELTIDQDKILLDSYFGADTVAANPVLMPKLQLFKVLSNLRESLWSYVQWGVSRTCTPEFYEQYGVQLFRRVKEVMVSPELDSWMKALED